MSPTTGQRAAWIRARWTPSESAFLISTIRSLPPTNSVAIGSTVPGEWAPVVQAMQTEQVRHHPGGDLFARVPWPQRNFNAHSLHRRFFKMVGGQQGFDQIAINGLDSVFSPAQSDNAQANEMNGLDEDPFLGEDLSEELIQSFQAEYHLMKPIWDAQAAGHCLAAAESRELLNSMSADQIEEAEFWRHFQERYGAK